MLIRYEKCSILAFFSWPSCHIAYRYGISISLLLILGFLNSAFNYFFNLLFLFMFNKDNHDYSGQASPNNEKDHDQWIIRWSKVVHWQAIDCTKRIHYIYSPMCDGGRGEVDHEIRMKRPGECSRGSIQTIHVLIKTSHVYSPVSDGWG